MTIDAIKNGAAADNRTAMPALCKVSDDFAIGKYPVTNREYAIYAAATGATHRSAAPGKDDFPVTLVSWRDAVLYCEWLSAQLWQTVALPTDEEWEAAARKFDWWIDGKSVWEWVVTDYDESNKVVRGGAWRDHRGIARCAYRGRVLPDYRRYFIGFRVVLRSPPVSVSLPSETLDSASPLSQGAADRLEQIAASLVDSSHNDAWGVANGAAVRIAELEQHAKALADALRDMLIVTPAEPPLTCSPSYTDARLTARDALDAWDARP